MLVRNINFNETLHQYTDEENFIYTSVTTKIKSVEKEFDKEYWLAYKAKELNISKEELNKEWTNINKASCERGNIIHKKLEDAIDKAYGGKTTGITDINNYKGFKKQIKNYKDLNYLLGINEQLYNYLNLLINNDWILYTELRVYLREYGIAGTIDLCAIKNTDAIIIDYKTNKDDLNFKSGYYKKIWINGRKVKTDIWIDKKEYFKKPLNNLEYCKGNVYKLQLSTYGYIIELWNYNIKGLVLFHIKPNSPVKIYNLDYLRNEAKKLIEYDNSASLFL